MFSFCRQPQVFDRQRSPYSELSLKRIVFTRCRSTVLRRGVDDTNSQVRQ